MLLTVFLFCCCRSGWKSSKLFNTYIADHVQRSCSDVELVYLYPCWLLPQSVFTFCSCSCPYLFMPRSMGSNSRESQSTCWDPAGSLYAHGPLDSLGLKDVEVHQQSYRWLWDLEAADLEWKNYGMKDPFPHTWSSLEDPLSDSLAIARAVPYMVVPYKMGCAV